MSPSLPPIVPSNMQTRYTGKSDILAPVPTSTVVRKHSHFSKLPQSIARYTSGSYTHVPMQRNLGVKRISEVKMVLKDMPQSIARYTSGTSVRHTVSHFIQLVQIKKWISDQSRIGRLTLGSHSEHCLEALRVGTMCTGNTGLWSFDWLPNVTKAHAKTMAQRNCVDWDAIDSGLASALMGLTRP
jgi:hypothetical protein